MNGTSYERFRTINLGYGTTVLRQYYLGYHMNILNERSI